MPTLMLMLITPTYANTDATAKAKASMNANANHGQGRRPRPVQGAVLGASQVGKRLIPRQPYGVCNSARPDFTDE